ncbi:Trp biosynthesis-associated membrane protein [Georgenia sp. TF02-10]|uniref:Trp biosynthesis-associated membrane protein n=1 Tax=Georgenia sp. TF02-10 TaxID=2917725 RepID=UPI001FA7C6D2|nr:Trp biosynthesis-associated membrane protein [Georgenia sp. TF02-10]UNX56154.1 Trp biosynthesis-associated membrane protein [Georgenia sp. TF02-10]
MSRRAARGGAHETGAGGAGDRATARAARPARRTVVLAALVLAGLLLAVGALPWADGQAPTVLAVEPVSVSGTTAVPALAGAALVAGAAALAAGLGRRVAVTVAGVALLAAGVGAAVAVADFLADPAAPLLAAAAELSGVRQLQGLATTTPWPYAAVVLAVGLAGVGVVTLVVGRRWAVAGRRYERPARPRTPAADERTRAMDDWDALGRGEDPTAGR